MLVYIVNNIVMPFNSRVEMYVIPLTGYSYKKERAVLFLVVTQNNSLSPLTVCDCVLKKSGNEKVPRQPLMTKGLINNSLAHMIIFILKCTWHSVTWYRIFCQIDVLYLRMEFH